MHWKRAASLEYTDYVLARHEHAESFTHGFMTREGSRRYPHIVFNRNLVHEASDELLEFWRLFGYTLSFAEYFRQKGTHR